ncbi:hypothetical protein DERP_001979 [Dermatophagoides pteronyssinus]|uniref:Uncharacterized protein n=1 Tax=Dermatophagoides pteronyssinus TaxID=6956 RepID=A0ABQ8JBZ5_DERPT|nr:hypothetical protein DERP_001979 [Dermatophagoides pteronyssinus]
MKMIERNQSEMMMMMKFRLKPLSVMSSYRPPACFIFIYSQFYQSRLRNIYCRKIVIFSKFTYLPARETGKDKKFFKKEFRFDIMKMSIDR